MFTPATPRQAGRGRMLKSTPRGGNAGGDFGAAVDALVQDRVNKVEQVVPEFVNAVMARAIQNTPEVTGLLVGSWQVGFSGATGSAGTRDPGGQATLAKIVAKMASWQPGQRIYVVNSAFYAWWVEFGTAKMEPRAFWRRTMAEVPGIFNEVKRQVFAQ